MADIFRVHQSIADLHQAPRRDSMRVSQALYGETAQRLEAHEGWVRVKLSRDGYEGWVMEEALGPNLKPATHQLTVIASHIYPAANIKSAPVQEIYRGSALTVTGRAENFATLEGGGFVFAKHVEANPADAAALAAQYLGVPYLWGGKTARGLDCSGLIQIILQLLGLHPPRDSGPQCEDLGTPTQIPARNDLVFWKGHVGIMSSKTRLIHANGFHMAVVEEDLDEACARMGAPLAIKRL
jgi:cell wall-associated NlpC family hydrolase